MLKNDNVHLQNLQQGAAHCSRADFLLELGLVTRIRV